MGKQKPEVGENGRKLSALDRAVMQAMGEGRSVGQEDDPARQKYPQLWDWMSRCYQGKDYLRTPSSLSISLGPEGVMISVTDRDLCVTVAASCCHLDEALAAIEQALGSDNPPMKFWGKGEPHLRKRKPRN